MASIEPDDALAMGKHRDIPITMATERAIREAARSEPLKALAVRVPKARSTFAKVLVRTAFLIPRISRVEPRAPKLNVRN